MKPGDGVWERAMTASKVAAALGVSPWQSPRALWHEMRGDVPRDEATTVQKRGHYLEPAILQWWRDQHSEFTATSMEQPTYRMADSERGPWAAATPDLYAAATDSDIEALVEAKSTNSLDEWGQPGTDEIPTYYLTQCWWSMHVARVPIIYVPIIGPRLEFAEYVVEYDPEIGADLEQRMRAFYDSLSGDEPPDIDSSVSTFNVIRRLHKDIDPDLTVELDRDEALGLLDAVSELGHAEANDRLWRSRVIERMGRARYATHNGVRVARRQARGDAVSFVPLPKNLPLLEEVEAAS